MNKYISTLDANDMKFFYSILYQYEREDSHIGYDSRKIDKKTRNKVNLIHGTKRKKVTLAMPKEENTLVFKDKKVCEPILRNLRHAYAHACIEVEGENYIINKKLGSKCRLCGRINKIILQEFVNAIVQTRVSS